jgi:hypothetical protein
MALDTEYQFCHRMKCNGVKNAAAWGMTRLSSVDTYPVFSITCCLHLQHRRVVFYEENGRSCSSTLLLPTYRNTRCHVPEVFNLHGHHIWIQTQHWTHSKWCNVYIRETSRGPHSPSVPLQVSVWGLTAPCADPVTVPKNQLAHQSDHEPESDCCDVSFVAPYQSLSASPLVLKARTDPSKTF